MEHNLSARINMLEYCKRRTSRLHSSEHQPRVFDSRAGRIALARRIAAFRSRFAQACCRRAFRASGIGEDFSYGAPMSLYGATKLASEAMALEYGEASVSRYGSTAAACWPAPGSSAPPSRAYFPIGSTPTRAAARCATSASAACGKQVRDAFHPRDLAALVRCSDCAAVRPTASGFQRAGGGHANAMSLAQLNAWCDQRFGPHRARSRRSPRPYDVPWLVMDSRCGARLSAGARNLRISLVRFSKRSRGTPRASALARTMRRMKRRSARPQEPLRLLSVVIPARDEEGCIALHRRASRIWNCA